MAGSTCVFAAEIPIKAGRSNGGAHQHPCAELIRYLSGEGVLEQGGRRLNYRPGMIGVYQPGAPHCDCPRTDGLQLCVGVTSPEAKALAPGLYESFSEADWYWERIAEAIKGGGESPDSEKLDLLCGLLALVILRHSTSKRMERPDDYAEAARSELDAHFREDVDMRALAGKLFISPDYLRQVFRQNIGESPLGYLIRKRLETACELLNFTELPIGEVAQRVGLDNAYYFSRIFRKKLGCSPSEYRRRRRAQ